MVIEALNNLSGAIDSLLELLQLDVGECRVLEAVQHNEKCLFIEVLQLIQFQHLVVLSEDTAALLSISQHIKVLLSKMEFKHLGMILRCLLQSMKLFVSAGFCGRLGVSLLAVLL